MAIAPTNCTEGDVRLTGYRSSSPREGTVEICMSRYWGTICQNGWDSRDARVICSILGYPSLGMKCTVIQSSGIQKDIVHNYDND